MFDTMTITKVAGGLCGALLVLLLGKWAAEEIYHVAGHGEAAYVIEVEEDEGGVGDEQEVSFEDIMASADIEKGAKVFKKCSACHKLVEGENSTGPYLYGVVGRPVGGADDYSYSDAVAGLGGEWTPDRMNEFLTNPGAYADGSKMNLKLKKAEDRANVIAYLDSLDN